MIEQHVKKIGEGHRCVSLINSVDKKLFTKVVFFFSDGLEF